MLGAYRGGILVLLVALGGFAWACKQQPAADTRMADERAIRNADANWAKAAAARDIEGILSSYADDASMFPPNSRIATGKEAIRAVWSPEFTNPGFGIRWQPTKVEVSRAGDLAYAQGSYEFTLNDARGKPITDRGKYVQVWKKQPDGSWSAVADIWNSDLPSQPTGTR